MDSHDLRVAFAGLSTSLIADACSHLGVVTRVAPPGIRPLLPHQRVAGKALPLRYDGVADPLLELIRVAAPDDVLVVDNHGRVDEGCIGELLALEAQTNGLGGIIVWGAHRDTGALVSCGLPVFSYGSCPAKLQRPADPTPSAPTPARFGGFEIGRDDVVFADADGVVFVNDERLVELLRAAASIGDTKRGRAEAVRDGMGLRSQFWLDDFLMSKFGGGPQEGRQRWGPASGSNGAGRGGTRG